MAENRGNIVGFCEELALPIANEMGLTIWDVKFEKEGSNWLLRYYIDKDGGVLIDDCEKFSRAIDPILDDADPISQSYCLEVSSPGIERELRKPQHFQKYIGKKVTMRFIRPMDGVKEVVGELVSHNDGVTVVCTSQGNIEANKKQIAYVRLYDDFN